MQTEWWEKKADESKTYAAAKNSKMFFSATKEVYGPFKPRTTPLLSADGSTLLKENSSNNARWREHFSTLLNRPSTVDPTMLDQMPQEPVITSLDLPPNDRWKFRSRSNRPARENPLGRTGFLPRFSSKPVRWPLKHSKNSSPASGKKRMCPKNSGIPQSSPCSRTGAVRLRQLPGHLSLVHRCEDPGSGRHQPPHHQYLGGKLTEAQCGFRPNRSTTDMIFSIRRRSASNRISTSLLSSRN